MAQINGVSATHKDTNYCVHITYGEKREHPALIEVDNIVLCTSQESLRELQAPLLAAAL